MAEHNSDENGLEMFKSEVKEQAKVSESTTGSHAEVQRHSFLPSALDRSCFFAANYERNNCTKIRGSRGGNLQMMSYCFSAFVI
jgi:hypothetical protein